MNWNLKDIEKKLPTMSKGRLKSLLRGLESRLRDVHACWGGSDDPLSKELLTPIYRLRHLVRTRMSSLEDKPNRRTKKSKDR